MKYKHKNKNGVVSLVVTLFIMLIVSLVALSFATLMRREQRQALERQLSSQAFYAAETGINDALKALQTNPTYVGDISSCDSAPQSRISTDNGTTTLNKVLDASGRIEYTCVFVDQTPTELEYTIQKDNVTIVPLNATSGLTSLLVTWEDSGSSANPAYTVNSANFTPEASWLSTWPGMLRGQIIPSGAITKAIVQTDTVNFFAYPSNGSSVDPLTNTYEGDCDNATNILNCQINIPLSGSNNYTLVLRGVYDTSKVIIKGYAGAVEQQLSGAQVVIDSTGRAQDVVRRVRVNAPVRPDYTYPNFALQVGDDICKRLRVTPQSSDVENITVDGSALIGNLSCDPSTAN